MRKCMVSVGYWLIGFLFPHYFACREILNVVRFPNSQNITIADELLPVGQKRALLDHPIRKIALKSYLSRMG